MSTSYELRELHRAERSIGWTSVQAVASFLARSRDMLASPLIAGYRHCLNVAEGGHSILMFSGL